MANFTRTFPVIWELKTADGKTTRATAAGILQSFKRAGDTLTEIKYKRISVAEEDLLNAPSFKVLGDAIPAKEAKDAGSQAKAAKPAFAK